ncbi:cytochrome P450 [Melanogaster broomeanus]|nr:cytochrome P450 [Melanogaster broomeanus]
MYLTCAITRSVPWSLAVHWYLARNSKRSSSPFPLPPGPPGLPIVGNVRGIDVAAPWRTYARWGKQYDIIIINSEKVAKELLDERSNNYANRPHFVISLVQISTRLFMPYGPRWQSVPRFQPLQQPKVSTINSWTMANWGTKLVVEAMRPEVSMLFSTFPFLLYLPSWFPGMDIKRKGAVARPSAKACLEQTFLFAESGSTGPAMVLDALLKKDAANASEEEMQALKEAAGTAFGGASASALMTFFLAMLLFPEVQEKAQAQIDAVVGLDRVPTIEDRPSLTYVDAILRETLRWSPVLPLSIPTTTIESDVYQGYYIPKGNSPSSPFAMAHDEEKYPKPFDFIPERFLDEDGNLTQDDVVNIGYGFGRRICVGRHFADPSLWTAMVSILATFKISRAKDHDGRDVYFKPEWSTGLTTQPLPFPCNVTPRVVGLDAEKLEKMMGTGA